MWFNSFIQMPSVIRISEKEQGTVLCSSSNNSVTFSGKSIGPEEFFNRMVEALGIIVIDRCPKGKPRRREN